MLKQRYPGRKPTFTETCTLNYMDNGQSCIIYDNISKWKCLTVRIHINRHCKTHSWLLPKTLHQPVIVRTNIKISYSTKWP